MVLEGRLEEQREAIDAPIERAEQKDVRLVHVTLRQLARGLMGNA